MKWVNLYSRYIIDYSNNKIKGFFIPKMIEYKNEECEGS